VPFLGLHGVVVAESVLSTHVPFVDVESVCGLDPTRTVYLGQSPNPERQSIVFDASRGIAEAMRHLKLDHHCKKIGCITGILANPDTISRLSAWRGALQDLSLPWSESFEANGLFTSEGGEQATRVLLEKHPDLDAIFFMNDTMAIGGQQYLDTRSPELPKIRIIGMDDIEEARWIRQPLTTIRQPSGDMCRRAVQWLAEKPGPHFGGTETFHGSLIRRDTCGCTTPNKDDSRDEFIQEQMQTFFQSRMFRRAAQVLFSDLDPSTWDQRLAQALQRASIPWAGLLEWKKDHLPTRSLENVEFYRWIEFRDGQVVPESEQFQAPPEILADSLSHRQTPCILMPLVCESRFLGLVALEAKDNMESFYEPLMLQAAAALHGTRIMAIQKETQQELLAANLQLTNLSNRDELTGALNRRGFMLLAEQALHDVKREKGIAALVFADMDRLKLINDEFGHAEGDRAIRATSQALRESLRQTDIMARIGGDEFVIFARIKQESDVKRLVQRAEVALQAQAKNFPTGLKLGFSSGYAFSSPQERASLTQLMDQADTALYKQKEERHKESESPLV